MKKLIAVLTVLLFTNNMVIAAGMPSMPDDYLTVNAGPDKDVELPGTVSLVATVSAQGGFDLTQAVHWQWAQISGPVRGGVEAKAEFDTSIRSQVTVSFPQTGAYVLRAFANYQNKVFSDDVIIRTIAGPGWSPAPTDPPGNQAPKVNIHVNPGTVYINELNEFSAIVSDDGLPRQLLIYEWEIVSTPLGATARVLNEHGEETPVTFSRTGTYKLRLTVNDGELYNFDEITINVLEKVYAPAPTPTPEPRPTPTPTTPTTPTPTPIPAPRPEPTPVPVPLPTPTDPTIPTPTPSPTPTPTSPERAQIGIKHNPTTASVGAPMQYTSIVSGPGTDGAMFDYLWFQIGVQRGMIFETPNAKDTKITFTEPGEYHFRCQATNDTMHLWDSIVVVVPGTPQPRRPQVDIQNNSTRGWVGVPMTLTAVMSGPGINEGTWTYQWGKVGVQRGFEFSNPNEFSTRALFSEPGEYHIRFSATNGTIGDFDSLTITIEALPGDAGNPGPNPSPAPNGASVDILNSPQRVFIDMRPELTSSVIGIHSADVRYEWKKKTGPGEIGFSAPTQDTTQVRFSDTGDYVIRLTVTDRLRPTVSAFDEVSIHVDQIGYSPGPQPTAPSGPAPSPTPNQPTTPQPTTNKAPVVNVQRINPTTVYIGDLTEVASIVSDDGLPKQSLTYKWSMASGPAPVQFSTPNGEETAVTFTMPGIYVLRMTASDSVLSSYDEFRIHVLLKEAVPEQQQGRDIQPGSETLVREKGSPTIVNVADESNSPVVIRNMQGQVVRELPPANGRSISWDGRDNSGRKVPAGIYIMTVNGKNIKVGRLN